MSNNIDSFLSNRTCILKINPIYSVVCEKKNNLHPFRYTFDTFDLSKSRYIITEKR